jgi:hypothetical protein
MAIPENVMQWIDVYDPMEDTTRLVNPSKFDNWCKEHQAEIYTVMDVEGLTYKEAERRAYLLNNDY